MSEPMLRLTTPGVNAIRTGLASLATELADLRPFWTETFIPMFYQAMAANFAAARGWAPLSPAYARWKAAHFPTGGLLERSGALKASLLGPNAPYAIVNATPTTLTIGTSAPGALWAQLGTHRGEPRRPPLIVGRARVRRALQTFVRHACVVHVPTLVQPMSGSGLV